MGFYPIVGKDFVVATRNLSDNRFTYVELLVFGQAQICIGDEYTCEHRYTYLNSKSAISAFELWIEEGTEEPEGWHRHQPSNRRRTDGDPNKEYIHS